MGKTFVNFTSEIRQSFGRNLLDKIKETDDWSTISLQWGRINEMEHVNLMKNLMNMTFSWMSEVRVQGTLDDIKLTLSSFSTALIIVQRSSLSSDSREVDERQRETPQRRDRYLRSRYLVWRRCRYANRDMREMRTNEYSISYELVQSFFLAFWNFQYW